MIRFYYLASNPEYYVNYIETTENGHTRYWVNLAYPEWSERGSGGGASNGLNLR